MVDAHADSATARASSASPRSNYALLAAIISMKFVANRHNTLQKQHGIHIAVPVFQCAIAIAQGKSDDAAGVLIFFDFPFF
jgi:hypothetical protein